MAPSVPTPSDERGTKLLGLCLVAGIAAAFAGLLLQHGPVRQPQSYHRFADQRSILGVPHALNVLSNVGFFLVGLAGLRFIWSAPVGPGKSIRDWHEKPLYGLLFLGVLLTAFGSAYYHLEPSDERLMWDRLPMTLAFTAFFAAVVVERIKPWFGLAIVGPLVIAGLASAFYWQQTGDLRPYLFVQFFPLAAVPILLLTQPAHYSGTGDLFAALGCYVAGKGCEAADGGVYELLRHVISGHTLKHVLCGLAAWWVLHWLRHRRVISQAATDRAVRQLATDHA